MTTQTPVRETACDHSHTCVTTEPQHVTLTGPRAAIEFNITVNAKCRNGHNHTLYLIDISDVGEAATAVGRWAAGHVDTCPGPNNT